MSYTLIHYPKCSNSRRGLALLQENGIEPTIRLYMTKTAQLSEEELRQIAAQMGEGPRSFWREKNAKEAGLSSDATDAEIFAEMARNPAIIQRPIGINKGKATLGRPQENLLKIV